MKISKYCKVEGCCNKHYGNGYCKKHYKQIELHGHILNNTRFEPNEIIEDQEKNLAYIILCDRQGKEVARALIDLEDVEKVKNYRWSYRRNQYVAYNSFKEKCDKKLTHFILDSKGKHIYHKNLNTLDCRKENLILGKTPKTSFDINKMQNIIAKIDKFREENSDLPISYTKKYDYIFPVEIENIISYEEEQYFKRNIKNYQMILDKIK